MYSFSTKNKRQYTTEYSPLEISKFFHFDAFDKAGNRHVIMTKNVNFKSFRCIC